jgi:hypothetical protein
VKEDLRLQVESLFKDRSQVKDASARRKLEKKVAELEAKQNVTTEQIAQLGLSMSEDELAFVCEMLPCPSSLVHTWYDEDTRSDKIYNGRVAKLCNRKKCTFSMGYHTLQEDEDDAVDYDIDITRVCTANM